MNEQPNKKRSWSATWRYFWRRVIPPISEERRVEIQAQLRDSSHPDFDFFLLVLLSSVIATLGLLIDSPAVIIGAMLVAPLILMKRVLLMVSGIVQLRVMGILVVHRSNTKISVMRGDMDMAGTQTLAAAGPPQCLLGPCLMMRFRHRLPMSISLRLQSPGV